MFGVEIVGYFSNLQQTLLKDPPSVHGASVGDAVVASGAASVVVTSASGVVVSGASDPSPSILISAHALKCS